MKSGSLQSLFAPRLAALILSGLALIPPANLIWIVATTGADSLSNDYLRMIQVVDQVLSGQYAWANYFRDTLQNGVHSYAFLFLVRLAIIRLTHWSVYAEIYTGIFLAALKVLLLMRLLTLPFQPGRIAWRRHVWLLPILSALVFSNSQISVYTFGETALQGGLVQVFTLAGLLAVLQSTHTWKSSGIMGLCGVLASWSGGGGLAAWPIFLAALLLSGNRQRSAYGIWLAAAFLAFTPYLLYGVPARWIPPSLTRLQLWVTAIGYPFANQIGQGGLLQHTGALFVGTLGLLLAATGIALVPGFQMLKTRQPALPALLVILWGLTNAAQAVLSRVYLAPWYTTAFMPFWIGLVGLAYLVLHAPLDCVSPDPTHESKARRSQKAWAVACLFTIATAYAVTNLEYSDKSFYLASRSPASAACLRNYRNAPAQCEGLVFQWGTGHPTYLADLAIPLEKHALSVFAPHQQWTLQGDFALNTIQVSNQPGIPEIAWHAGWTDQPAAWSDPRHLNLLLHAPNRLTWQITLPARLERAVFHSALAMDRAVQPDPAGDGVTFRLLVEAAGAEPELLYSQLIVPDQAGWQELVVDLKPYAGETISLVLAARPGADITSDRLMLRYPLIDLELSPGAKAVQ